MSLRAALLGLLSEGPATGYELIKEFDRATSVIWPAPKGEVYRELARLETSGFAAPEKESGARRSRKWRITTDGKAELKRWLRSDTDYALRYEPMLRAAFLGSLSDGEIAERVALDRRFFETELAQLRALRGEPRKRPKRRLALPMAIQFYEAMLGWCDQVEALLKAK